MIVCRFAIAIVAVGTLLGCRSESNPKVVNGTLGEIATLNVSGYARVVVPATANVQEGKQQGSMELHIERARDYFGVAKREEDGDLLLATYGEWTSIEGGAQIRLDIIVPPGTGVEKRAGLSGDNSLAMPQDDAEGARLLDSETFRRCYWYTSISPGPEWQRVETTRERPPVP